LLFHALFDRDRAAHQCDGDRVSQDHWRISPPIGNRISHATMSFRFGSKADIILSAWGAGSMLVIATG